MPSGDNNAKQDKVRELQVKLYLAAKRSPDRRFHALWDRIHRRDVLQRAWQQVRENRGAAGVDRITIAQIEEQGVEAFLDELQAGACASSAIGPGRRGGCSSPSPVAPSSGRWASLRSRTGCARRRRRSSWSRSSRLTSAAARSGFARSAQPTKRLIGSSAR